MELKEAVCPNCGAKLKVDPSKDAAICEYCDSPFVVEKAIANVHFGNNYITNEAKQDNASTVAIKGLDLLDKIIHPKGMSKVGKVFYTIFLCYIALIFIDVFLILLFKLIF